MKKETYASLLKDLKAAAACHAQGAEDLYVKTKEIGEQVTQFLVDSNLGTCSDFANQEKPVIACESLGTTIQTLGTMNIVDLVKAVGINDSHVESACEAVFNTLVKHENSNPSEAWSNQIMSTESFNPDLNIASMADLVGTDANRFLDAQNEADISFESFGVDVDKATPDLRLDLTIALLRFHSDLTMAMIPTRATNQPTVSYIRNDAEVYDLTDANKKPVQIIDLYENGAMVDSQLRPIIVKAANAVDGNVIADGIVATGKPANILELSIDSGSDPKPGYAVINATDIVAEGTEVKAVTVSLTAEVGGTVTTEQFKIDLPAQEFRFSRSNDNDDVAERVINKEYEVFLGKDAITQGGQASAICGVASSTQEGMFLTVYVSAKLNIKTGAILGNVNGAIRAANLQGNPVSTELTGLVADIKGRADGIIGNGYELNAYFAEDNMRKANIAARTSRKSIFYEIRPGRTYQLDYAIKQQNAAESISILANILRIGQGKRTITTVRETLEYVARANKDIENGLLDPKYGPARKYVAGGRVRPYVIQDKLDITSPTSNNDMNMAQNIRQRAIVFLNAIVSELASKTFLHQQVAGSSAVHYRVVTSNEVLDNVLSQDTDANKTMIMQENKGAIEQSIILPCGVILDIITTTEKDYGQSMLLYPVFSPAESELNFGQNWNYGQFSGHYPVQGKDRANYNRIYTSTREQVIPTNPMGAIIDIVGMKQAVFRPTTNP